MIERLIWLVPLAVAAAGLWRPRAGLLALAALLPFFGSPPGGPYLGALEVAGLAAILTAWRAGAASERSALDRPLAAFVVVALLSLLPLAYLPPSWRPDLLAALLAAMPGVEAWHALYTWRTAVGLLLGWGLFLTVRRAWAGRSPRDLGLALAAGLAATIVLGLAGHFGLVDLGVYRPTVAVYAPIRRLYSVFFNSGWLAEYLVLATPFAVAALLAGGRRSRRLALALAALALVTLALTRQRGGWAAAVVQASLLAGVFLAGGGLALFADPVRRRRMALIAAGGLVVGAAIMISAGDSLGPTAAKATRVSSGLSGRPQLWLASSELIAERPVAGWGLGSFAGAYDSVRPRGSPEARPFRETAHNTYLHLAVEQGLLGLAALALVAWAAVSALRRILSGPSRRGSAARPEGSERLLALGLGVAFVGGAIHALVQYLLYIESVAWLLWILAGALAALDPGGGRRGPDRAALALVLAGLLLAPWRLVAGEAAPLAGTGTFGLHEPERSSEGEFQWTEGRAAMRLEPRGETLVLELANGHPRAAERPVTVELRADGERLGELVVRGGWQEQRFFLGPPGSDPIVLEILARPAFRPFSDFRRYPDLKPSWDIRSLGVAVRGIRWE